MKIDGIISLREYPGKVFADIVYEWEEDLSRLLSAPIINWGRKHQLVSTLLHRMPWMPSIRNLVLSPTKRYLRFVMNALDDTPLFNHKSCIPVIIDFFVAPQNMQRFIDIYDRCDYVFISSHQVYDMLLEYKLPFKIVHFPLTLSDRYLFADGMTYKKRYDLTLFGAQILDRTLSEYIARYSASHPDFVYVSMKKESNLYYDNKGTLVGDASSRVDYFNLLRASKTVIYSTPGIRGRADSNGYDQVTPKFLEFIASQCQVIPRYSDNSDTRYFELPSFATSINTYDDFVALLDDYMATEVDAYKYRDYLQKHTTSVLPSILASLA